MSTVKLAAANMHVKYMGYEENSKKIISFIHEAGQAKTDFLVFPEVGLHGYMKSSLGQNDIGEQKLYYRRTAEPIPGPFTSTVQLLARQYNMYIQVGLAEKALNGDALYNSAVIVGPDGIHCVFRKMHNQFEYAAFNPGNALPVIELPFAKVGPFICYDLAFPEVNRVQALKGANLLSLSTAWPMFGKDMDKDHNGYCYDVMSRANCIFNHAWMVSSNHAEHRDDCWYYGHSRIITPDGYIIAQLRDEEGLVSAEVDLNEAVDNSRTKSFFSLSMLQDRHPEYYGLISNKNIYYESGYNLAQDSQFIPAEE